MSDPSDPTSAAAAGGPQAGGPAGEPSEAELRAAYEAELARITAVDMLAQSAVSLLNIGARRMGPPPGLEGEPGAVERDLDQVRDAIDGARALLAILERRIPQELGPLKDALSRLQMAYAQEVGAEAQPPAQAAAEEQVASGAPVQQPDAEDGPGGRRPGPAESSGKLWVPGS